MTDLAAFQAAFVGDLLRRPQEQPTSVRTGQPGFAVYRNTVMRACIDALAANYPTVQELLGDECFRDLARDFVHHAPPGDGVLARYGEGFASFIERTAASDLAYLAEVAELDRCWTEAHLAADDPVVSPAAIAGLAAEDAGRWRLVLHPAARWRAFESRPAFTIWRRHRERLAIGDELDWKGESALLVRPGSVVSWCEIDAASVAFLAACDAERTLVEALEIATLAGDESASWLPGLLHAGAFTRLAAVGE